MQTIITTFRHEVFFLQMCSTDKSLQQFRFSMGAPDAEAKFKATVAEAQRVNKTALKYPSLFVSALALILHYLS
jgi:hypothetical protein